MKNQDWERLDRWHRLFDELCGMRGHYDNAALASELCRRTGKSRESDHETAEKNLRAWRVGRRLPLRRNVTLLAQMFEVEGDPVLAARWELLHQAARQDTCDDPVEDTGSTSAWNAFVHLASPRCAAVVACLVGAGLVVGGGVHGRMTESSSLGEVGALPTIAYNARVVVSVGTSKFVNGRSGGCNGEPPPTWEQISHRIPESSVGLFEDGGVATQMNNHCGKEVVVRAVRFKAVRPGIEELTVLGTYLRVEVVGPPVPAS